MVAANVALFRHDVHFDVSREGRNTPPAQLMTVISSLSAPLSLTYFYNAGDPHAQEAKDLIEIAAHGHPLFAFRAIDLDKEPGLARDIGVRAYNTAVLQAGDRKVLVENVPMPTRIGYAALRALENASRRSASSPAMARRSARCRPIIITVTLRRCSGHDQPGAGDVLVVAPEQLDRLQLALNEIGFEMRPLVMAHGSAIPADCTVVADIGPRTAFAAGEADLLAEYLEGGGRVAVLLDPLFPLGADLQRRLLGAVGPATEPAIIDRSAQPFPHRSGQGRGALLSPASDHRAARAHGVSAGAADPACAAAGGVNTTSLPPAAKTAIAPPAAAGGSPLASGGPAPLDAEPQRPGARGCGRRRVCRGLARQALSVS